MNKSENLGNLAKALSVVQSKLQPALKDAKNPFFKNNYSTLNSVWDSCRALLSENGLSVVQTNEPAETGVIVETVLLHISNEWISGSIFLPLAKHDPQGVGSAISYGRRYGLAAIIGIVSDEDDDGNHASRPREQHKPQQATPQQPKPQELSYGERIRKAEAALKNLGVNEPPVKIDGRPDEELIEELDALNKQYTRLKNTKGVK